MCSILCEYCALYYFDILSGCCFAKILREVQIASLKWYSGPEYQNVSSFIVCFKTFPICSVIKSWLTVFHSIHLSAYFMLVHMRHKPRDCIPCVSIFLLDRQNTCAICVQRCRGLLWFLIYLPSLGKKATVHRLTTMLATFTNVLFLGHNHLLTTGAHDSWLSPECQWGW